MDNILSIGSVVLLKGGTKKVMVTGYLAVNNDNQKEMYDYSGCLYPEGFLDSEQVLLFNQDQIKEIYFNGYSDEEQEKFFQKLSEFNQSLLKKDPVETLDV